MHTLEAFGLQLFLQHGGGHHGDVCAVMEFFQIHANGTAQPTDAVMLAVGMEVGAEIGADRQLEFSRYLQRRPSQRPFGCDMHDIRSLLGPEPMQFALGGQSHAQLAVKGNRHALDQYLLKVCRVNCRVLRLLLGSNQPEVVTPRLQTFHNFAQGVCHPIDIRRIGFRHDSNFEPLLNST